MTVYWVTARSDDGREVTEGIEADSDTDAMVRVRLPEGVVWTIVEVEWAVLPWLCAAVRSLFGRITRQSEQGEIS
jgi:hypothetical protein